jgi:FkbM family methyltransferase
MCGRPLVDVPFGSEAHVIADLTTPLGLALYRYRSYNDPDLELIRVRLSAGDVFVDGGANIGLFSLIAAHCVGVDGHVYALEPAPRTRMSLCRNIGASGFTQVTVLPYALSDRWGSSQFSVMPHGGGTSSLSDEGAKQTEDRCAGAQIVTVLTGRLDDIVPQVLWDRLTLIKLDVEGAEVSSLRGAQALLRFARPALLVEVVDEHLRTQGSSERELQDLLTDLGYRALPGAAATPNVLYLPS